MPIASARADVGDVSALDIAACIPVAARAHVLLQRSEAEHRTITAAFIDLMDTDRLLEEARPRRARRGARSSVSARSRRPRSATRCRSTRSDVGKSSVKALLTAGAPSTTGHDEERMLRALREVMEPARSRPDAGRRQHRQGLHRRLRAAVPARLPRVRRRHQYRGAGHGRAEAGQILSTEIVLNRSRTLFETTPIEPFAAKGKAELVHASIVGPAIGRRRSAATTSRLIGRDDELATLLEVDRGGARGPRLRSSRSPGSPGLGKTRLVEELIARSPDFRILRSRCEEYEASTPYFAFRALIRDVIGVDADVEAGGLVTRLREQSRRSIPSLARGYRCSASCSASTCRPRRRRLPSTSASCAIAWVRWRCSSST